MAIAPLYFTHSFGAQRAAEAFQYIVRSIIANNREEDSHAYYCPQPSC